MSEAMMCSIEVGQLLNQAKLSHRRQMQTKCEFGLFLHQQFVKIVSSFPRFSLLSDFQVSGNLEREL